MKVMPPIDIINSSILTTSSIGIGTGDPAAWNSGTNYAIGDRVRLESQKKIYEALVAGVNATSPELNPSKWFEVQTMNRWVMFDYEQSGVKSFATDTIDLVFTPDTRVSSIAILNFENLDEIYILVKDSLNVTLYENTYVVSSTDVNYVNFNIPVNKNNVIEISLSGTGTIKVERVILSSAEYLGEVQRDITVNSLNFSNIDRDDFGFTNIVKRRGVATLNKTLFVSNTRVPRLVNIRDELNAVPAVWCALDDGSLPEYANSLILFGIYRQFSIRLDSPIHATLTLELEEL